MGIYIYSKYPHNPAAKGHCCKILQQYLKARKTKFREYKQSLLRPIESLYDENPQKYWQLLINCMKKKIMKIVQLYLPLFG